MFESDYARTEYIEKDNAVLHTWKKEAHFDDYRKPVEASLEMLREHAGSVFIVDARNGFEDVTEDVEWGFNYFLPELRKQDAQFGDLFFLRLQVLRVKLICGQEKLRRIFA